MSAVGRRVAGSQGGGRRGLPCFRRGPTQLQCDRPALAPTRRVCKSAMTAVREVWAWRARRRGWVADLRGVGSADRIDQAQLQLCQPAHRPQAPHLVCTTSAQASDSSFQAFSTAGSCMLRAIAGEGPEASRAEMGGGSARLAWRWQRWRQGLAFLTWLRPCRRVRVAAWVSMSQCTSALVI